MWTSLHLEETELEERSERYKRGRERDSDGKGKNYLKIREIPLPTTGQDLPQATFKGDRKRTENAFLMMVSIFSWKRKRL